MYSSYATKYNAYDIDLNEVINFLKQNPQFLQNEVNPYSVDKLMMLLDNEKLSALEEEFNEHPNGIELPDFVLLMKSTILHPPEDKFRLITGLIKLFQDIDINGDGHMEWSEFTQYIIDAVIGEKDTKFFDARFEKDRELTENEILDKAYSSKTKRYVMSKIVDNTIHLSLIKKINYCSNNDMLAVLEQGAKRIKMYTTQSTLSKEFFEPVFEEKAFVLDCCYSERLNMIGCITTDRRVIVWENTTAKREVVSAKHDVLPTGIWYLENHKVWIVAGADNGLRSYTYGSNDRNQAQTEKGPLLSHTKKITEVTEISIPKLVASSSLDGTIKLWDLSDRTLITELKDTSTARGIRGITYSFDYGGNLLSYGFESYINIWCPEVSLTRSYVGKLEGHSHTILCCKFIPGSPNCVSVDEKGNIRLWDIRTLTTIQLISAENSSVVVTELAIIPKHDKFILGGKRMTFYDNSAISKSIKHFNEELYPIAGYYNEYYNTVVVLTKIDLRIYDVLTGKLKKVFTDLTDERFNTSDLSSFTFGGKQRKFYIGDNSGYVRVYNMKNGEIIHKINKINEEQELDKKKDLDKKKSLRRRENAEISNIVYLTDEKLLITASWDSTIRIYDESEPDESTLLRIMSGAHRESDINAMAYSSHLNLLASGSGNGIIAIWDLELGKLEQVCLGHTADITALQFLDPFPILVSASSDGSICVWGVRPCAEIYRYKCIMRILNSSWKTEKKADDTEVLVEVRSGITSLVVETENKTFVERQPLAGFPTIHEYRDFVQKSIEKKQESKMASSNQRNQNKNSNEPEDKEKPHIHMNAEEYKALGLEFLDDALYCPLNKPPDNLDYYETLEEFAKYREAHDAQDPNENEAEQRNKKKRCYVYYGDQKGFMNVIDLAEILKKRDIRPCKSEKRTDSYQLRRKEWIDVSKTVDNMLSNEKLRKTPYSIHSYNTVLINRWEAHTQAITNINKIDGDKKSLITCSMDKYVKVWSLAGDLYGGFNLVKLGKKSWGFPFDWTQHKLQEIDDAFSVLNFIEKDEMRRLTDQDKNNVKFQYLLNSFGNEKDFVRAIKAFKNNKGIVEKKIETPVKEKEPVKKEFEIPAYLQADIEEKEKERERERMKEKEKTKGKGKGKVPEKAKENLDAKDYGEERKAMATDFKGLAQKVFISIEKFEKDGKKDPKVEKVPSHSNKASIKIRSDNRLKTAGAKIKGFEPLDAMLKNIIGDRKNEKSGPSSRVGSSLSKRITGLTQNYKSSGVILPAIEGIHEEGITSEDVVYNPRTTTQPGSRATSARPLFSNFSAKTFKKNIDHATKLVKNYAGNPSHPYKAAEPEDIKFRQGEGARTLKIAARQQIEKFASDSPQIFANEREALASRSEFYRNLRAKNTGLQGDAGANSDRETGREETYKIIANRLFMEDPEKNKMKVLKSNNRLYVL